MPGSDEILFLTPLAILYAWVAAGLAGRLRAAGTSAPYTRKVFHFSVFTAAGIVQLAWGLDGVMVFGSVLAARVLLAVLRPSSDPLYEAMARPSDAPHRTLFIMIPLFTTAAGGLLANIFFSPWAFVGYLVCGWGDAVGEPVGTRWGRHRYRVPSLAGVPATRSLEGSAAVLVAGAAAAAAALLLAGVAPATALRVGMTAGAAGAAVEAFSTHGLDNLTTQLAAAAVAAWLL